MTRNFKHIAECTQLNEHSEAIMLGAIYFGLEDIKREMAKIIYEQNDLGYLDHFTSQRRYEIYQQLLSHAKKMLNEQDYQNFYMSF